MENFNEIIGKKIKKLREEKQYTQQTLADKVHTSKQNLSRYEKGDVQIPLQMIKEFANIFDVSIDYLFGNTDIKNYSSITDITVGEKNLINAYRQNKEMQSAVNKLLGISDIETYSIEDDAIEVINNIKCPTNKK